MKAAEGVFDGERDFGREKGEVEGQECARDLVVVSFVTRTTLASSIYVYESNVECILGTNSVKLSLVEGDEDVVVVLRSGKASASATL